jgi:NAD-dependent dihydropyrimidine dehydrogenase PreA subunit
MVYLRNVVSLELDETACTGCGRCVEVCPHEVFVMESGRSRIGNRDACMECGACARNCPSGAIQVRNGAGCATGIFGALLRRGACACHESDRRGTPHE